MKAGVSVKFRFPGLDYEKRLEVGSEVTLTDIENYFRKALDLPMLEFYTTYEMNTRQLNKDLIISTMNIPSDQMIYVQVKSSPVAVDFLYTQAYYPKRIRSPSPNSRTSPILKNIPSEIHKKSQDTVLLTSQSQGKKEKENSKNTLARSSSRSQKLGLKMEDSNLLSDTLNHLLNDEENDLVMYNHIPVSDLSFFTNKKSKSSEFSNAKTSSRFNNADKSSDEYTDTEAKKPMKTISNPSSNKTSITKDTSTKSSSEAKANFKRKLAETSYFYEDMFINSQDHLKKQKNQEEDVVELKMEPVEDITSIDQLVILTIVNPKLASSHILNVKPTWSIKKLMNKFKKYIEKIQEPFAFKLFGSKTIIGEKVKVSELCNKFGEATLEVFFF